MLSFFVDLIIFFIPSSKKDEGHQGKPFFRDFVSFCKDFDGNFVFFSKRLSNSMYFINIA